MRQGMGAVVAQIRLLVGDTDVLAPVFSDEEVQSLADGARTDVLYQRLTPLPTIAPGGATSYLTWVAAAGWWETDGALVDGGYTVLTPAASDWQRGRWTFGAHQSDVLLSGACYDIYAAAAAVVEAWLARVKLEYDFSADGADYKRSQQINGLTALLARLRAQVGGGAGGANSSASGATVGRLVRRDTC